MSSPSNSTHHTEPVLSTSQLACVRGEQTLFQGLEFSLTTGQCLHVVGANGSGKTSLLRILCGLNNADQGNVYWRNSPLSKSEVFANESAYIGHKDGLKNELTALENLAFQQNLEQTSEQTSEQTPKHCRDEDQLDDVLAQLKILKCADLPAQVLSFGQRRRLAFAKLLLSRKQLWILDEPFTGIDTSGRTLIEQLCINHLEQDGLIVLTHHQNLASSPLNRFTNTLQLEEFAGG